MDINKFAAKFQTFFTETANIVARSTKFVQRKSKLTGSLFLQTMVFGFMEEPEASLTDLGETGHDLGVDITPQGLHDRIQQAVPFLKQMFQDSVALFRNEVPLDLAVLKQFSGIFVTDSSVIAVPDALQAEFPGCGGDGPEAAVKIQLTVELLYGVVAGLSLEAGRAPDQGYTEHLAQIQADALYLCDLGYFVLAHFREVHDHHAYFLSRFDPKVSIFEPETEQPIDLLEWLRQQTGPSFEQDWLLGAKEKLRCRVVGVRAPQEVADRRRQKARQNAQRKGRTLSARYLELLDWAIYITNVPASMLTLKQILVMYAVRWQIELVFKVWKSQGECDRVAGRCRPRVLGELYAKMIGLVITQCLLAPWRWGQRELSMVKAHRILRHYALRLAQALPNLDQVMTLVDKIIARCLKRALREKHPKRLSTYQKLAQLEPHDNALTETHYAFLFAMLRTQEEPTLA
jgi:hypothetical protein